MKQLFKKWWDLLRFEPDDPRLIAGGDIRIAAIGGGTGLANLLRGLKKYSRHISAIVTVADNGGSTGRLRKDFDTLSPGDIRKCISALAYDEELVSNVLEHRFLESKKTLGGHTLGNIWITALTDYFKSFERAIEATSEIFQTAGKVLPSTLQNIDLVIEYGDGKKTGEKYLDLEMRQIKKISLNRKAVSAYKKAVAAIVEADLILIGPGSLYGSILPNLLIPGIRRAILANKKAVKVYIANCSTERTQTRSYTIDDHIRVIKEHVGSKMFDFCLVNNHIVRLSKDETVLGAVNNITTEKKTIDKVKIVSADVVNIKNPLYHDSQKLAKAVIELYNKRKS
jgi:uncharacterized cofD-like protein